MIQFPNYLTLDCAKPVGGMCQQLRWYIHTNYCYDFALRFIIHSSLLACIHASLISSLWFTHFSLYSLNTHHHTSCVFIFIHSLINFDFTFLTFHLCLFILFLHTATFIDQFFFSSYFDHNISNFLYQAFIFSFQSLQTVSVTLHSTLFSNFISIIEFCFYTSLNFHFSFFTFKSNLLFTSTHQSKF